MLAAVGLENAADASVKQYSLGMKRRLDIGTALLGNPQLLIMDEPINGLDPVGVIEVRDLLLSLKDRRDNTVLISSHNLDELEKVATSFAFLHQGRLLVKEENSYKDRSLEKRFLDLIGEADNATSATD